MRDLKIFMKAGAVGAVLLVLASCSSTPERVELLEQAQAMVSEVDRDPLAGQVAQVELQEAKNALERAEVAREDDADIEIIRHNAYLALRNAEIAKQRIAQAQAQREIDQSEARRNRVIMEVRTREAERARRLAEARSREAEQRALEAGMAREEAERARQDALAARQESEESRARAEAAMEEARNLQQALSTLEAEQTNRGLVVTLDDVLFDTGKAELKAGAEVSMARLAAVMQEYPDRRLMIEGHTDSMGEEDYNEILSRQRAESVRDALVKQGVSPDRLITKGLGEEFPVTTNDTAAGRQQNRRVEIVVSSEDGEFPAAANRNTMGSL